MAMAFPVWGATYYVDFSGGDNQSDGLTPQTAWKHSPGDRNATDTPAAVELQPGDTVVFKGGVPYFGEIQWNVSGSEGKPITLDGNTAGTFGEGRAILDGARMITDWQRCASAEQVEGNPRWNEIRYADLDVDLTDNFNQDRFVPHRDAGEVRQAPWQRLFLVDGERQLLPIAQRPKPSDPFYPDLPGDFYHTPDALADNYPHRVYYEPGTIGNQTLPLIAITFGGNAPVIQPFDGGAVSVDMNEPATISEMGFTLFRPATTPVPEHIVFLADGKEVLKAEVDRGQTAMQRFVLPKPVNARKLTFQLRHSKPGDTTWTKLQQIAAFTPGGTNVVEHPISSVIRDEERLVQKDPRWYDGMFVGVHGGNNHVYFARVRRYDPKTHQLYVPHFQATAYDMTRYALYNSPRFIERPGEWCLVPLEDGRTRVYLLPERLQDGQPANIGYPVLKTGILLIGEASHIDVRGFLIQRYSGGAGAVATRAARRSRPSHVAIADCEVRFISGQSGISLNHSDHVVVENCAVYQCPGWTVGIYVNRTNHFRLSGNRLDKNSGSGIRHYEAKHGVLRENVVLNHFGMHSSGLNFYEGCSDILFEGNYVHNTVAINRNAERLVFRNNVIDGLGRAALAVGMWTSGSVGGRAIKDVHFVNNTFVNTDPGTAWATGILGQRRGSPSPPHGLIIRNNILCGMAEDIAGAIENNIYTRPAEQRFMGPGCQVVADPNVLFRDPARGDYRRKPNGPAIDVGANIPPPPGATAQ
ncbi:MAG: right-handed parallel beta-helix repeat-containing protein [Thermoguttaceae bacterium]|jgi:parallel beta-helix repeat protein|nr:right-handed parallel beta-helix repeat-containing protein [Thermoguttaceae bacterium]